MAAPSTPRLYRDRYCEKHGLSPEKFELHLLRASLRPPLRWVWPLLGWSIKSAFELDYICIKNIGRSSNRKDVGDIMSEFSYHSVNLNFWRRRLGQRISTRRVLQQLKGLPK